MVSNIIILGITESISDNWGKLLLCVRDYYYI